MKNFLQDFISLALLCCIHTCVCAADLIRNLDTLNGYDGYTSNLYTPQFQDNASVRVGGWGDWYAGFTRFNVSSLPNNVQNVSLWYWVNSNTGNTTTVSMTMYGLATAFGPSQYWINNTYIYTGSNRAVAQPQNGNWITIDITDYYRNWKSGAWQNNGILLLPTGNNNQFNIMPGVDTGTQANQKPFVWVSYNPVINTTFMRFPIDADVYPQGAYTPGKITSILDHNMDTMYATDGKILSFTGELFQATVNYPQMRGSCYPKINGVWSSVLQNIYRGTSGCFTNQAMNYEGHPGYDYRAVTNTSIRAVAAGIIVNSSGQPCLLKGITSCAPFGAIAVDHGNGYISQYLHLNRVDVYAGQQVFEGQQIGLSGETGAPGQPHLHFEVFKLRNGATNNYNPGNYAVVDPYGFDTTSGIQDYLSNITGITNVKLWK